MSLPSTLRSSWGAVAMLAALAGCGRETSSSGSAASGDDAAAFTPPKRPPRPPPDDAADGGLLARRLPRIEYRGGPFLRHPKVVTITFTKDDPKLVARVEELGSTLTRSAWWRTVVDGYCAKPDDCIGEGGAGSSVHLDETLPAEISDDDTDALLLRAAKVGRLGPLDANTLLLLYLPSGIGLHDATTPHYCAGSARAFHRSLEIEGKRIAIAVLPRCGGEAELTGTASHEILEATTNPFPAEHGFAFVSGNGPSGFTGAGLEPVDPCGLVTMDRHWTTESGFVVHRAWSNRAAARALEPCVPSRPGLPYAMLVPREGALRLPRVGESVTVELDATAAGSDTSLSWAVSAFDLSGFHDHQQYVELAVDKTTVRVGESVKLTIKALKMNPQRELVALVSTLGVHSQMWPLVVMMR